MLKFYLHAFHCLNINYGCRNHSESYRHNYWKTLTCVCTCVCIDRKPSEFNCILHYHGVQNVQFTKNGEILDFHCRLIFIIEPR